ncbi:MAG: fumarylacetoacetate hydrolase family protein [Halobacteriales archaeon]
MHHVRFRDPAGSVRNGFWTADGIVFGQQRYDAAEVDILPPCEPEKIVCVGRNYVEHADERDNEVPDRPLLFLKPPNTLAGHHDTVTLPAGKERIDHEAELAVVIAQQCRDVRTEEAMQVVAGFSIANDLSNRDDQNREQNWVRGKAFDNACPLGPVIAEPNEVPADATINLTVNGVPQQEATREQMIFDVPDLIAEITQYMTLEPGDVILTGTPAGVGGLNDGDQIEINVEGIGGLEHSVRIPEA